MDSEGNAQVLSPGLRADLESWFARRGVPQLIDDYTTERRMDIRARPYLLSWLVAGSFLWWGSRPGAAFVMNLLGGLIVLGSVVVGLILLRRLKGGVRWWREQNLDVIETFSLGLWVAIPSALLERSWTTGIGNGLNALLGIGVVYMVIGLGLVEIGRWSLRRLRSELGRITQLLARTLPTLLILVLFLLFAAELWEAAHALSSAEFALVVLLFALVASVLVLTAYRGEVPEIQGSTLGQLRERALETPAAPIADTLPDAVVPRLRVLQRLNLAFLVLIGQLIQSVFVALLVSAFLIVFGILALPVDLQDRWIGESVSGLATFTFLGETRALTLELVVTACLLGIVVGLYFTGLAVTDTAYRSAHFDRILSEVRLLLAAWAFYVVVLRDDPGPPDGRTVAGFRPTPRE